MDARKTIEKLKGEADRERVSLYLSKSILKQFKQACGNIAPSRVMEELMKEFTASADKSKDMDRVKKVKKSSGK